MKDQLISFETAKLAKEKGFDWKVTNGFTKTGLHFQNGPNTGYFPNEFKRPIKSELHIWLMLNNIFINVQHKPYSQKFSFNITGSFHEGNQGILKAYDFKTYDSYADALEEGLIEGLKLIK